MLDNLFLEVLNLTITGSFVILGVIVARLLMLKFPKKYSYLLWAIVLVRLLIPISWESDLSLMPTTSQPIFTPGMVYETVPQVDTGVEVLDEVINPILPPVTQPEASVNPIQIRIFVGRVLWMTGMTAMAVYGLVQYFLLKRRLSTAIPLENRIYLADNIPSPFVLGLFAPKIYLPSHLQEWERGYIIAHEQCHLKRFDHVTRVLAFVALTIHWFNPLVWVAFVLSERDMERSCDEAVMRTMEGDIRRDYAASLLRFATRGRLISATPLAFGEGDTKGRVKNVMGYKKPVIWVTVVAIVLAVCVGVGLIFNREGEEQIAPEVPEITSIFVSDDVITGNIDPLSPVIQTAMELVGKQVDYYAELGKEHDFVITQAEITGLGQVSTGTASESMEINLYTLEYRLTPDHIDNVPLVGGMSIDNGAITEWGSTGQPYLLFYSPGGDYNDEIFIEMTNTDTIFADYGSDELLEEYGTAFTAYCMERYEAYQSELDETAMGTDGDSYTFSPGDRAFVYAGDGVISGREYLDAFEEAAANREDASLRCVYQYTPDGTADPVLALTDIVYEDEIFTVTQYPTTPEETQLVNTYQYLVTETVPPMSSTAKYETCRAHYLVNAPDVTYWDYMSGLLSSQLGAGEDAYVIYVEFIYPEE